MSAHTYQYALKAAMDIINSMPRPICESDIRIAIQKFVGMPNTCETRQKIFYELINLGVSNEIEIA